MTTRNRAKKEPVTKSENPTSGPSLANGNGRKYSKPNEKQTGSPKEHAARLQRELDFQLKKLSLEEKEAREIVKKNLFHLTVAERKELRKSISKANAAQLTRCKERSLTDAQKFQCQATLDYHSKPKPKMISKPSCFEDESNNKVPQSSEKATASSSSSVKRTFSVSNSAPSGSTPGSSSLQRVGQPAELRQSAVAGAGK